jgi:tRNA (cmo5U34)-methyltransferase
MTDTQESARGAVSVGDSIALSSTRWSFGDSTPDHFDDHVKKSIPLYAEGHELIASLATHFAAPHGKVIDVGCSTGTLLSLLADRLREGPDTLLGYDIETDMIKTARQRCKRHDRIKIYAGDASTIEYQGSHVVVMYYTLQFVHPQIRLDVLRRVHAGLAKGGALFLFEKTLCGDARLQEIMDQQYIEFKFRNGFTAEEIYAKSESLRAVLYPHASKEIYRQLGQAGFRSVTTIQKYLNFEGILAVK